MLSPVVSGIIKRLRHEADRKEKQRLVDNMNSHEILLSKSMFNSKKHDIISDFARKSDDNYVDIHLPNNKMLPSNTKTRKKFHRGNKQTENHLEYH